MAFISSLLGGPATPGSPWQTAVEYDGAIGGRPTWVIVVRGSNPALVITAYWADR